MASVRFEQYHYLREKLADIHFPPVSGIFIALPPVIFVGLTKDKSRIGTRIGMGMAMFGLGVLAGGPGGGAILQRRGMENSELDWTGTWIFGGVCLLAAGMVFVVLRIWKGGIKLMVKC